MFYVQYLGEDQCEYKFSTMDKV